MNSPTLTFRYDALRSWKSGYPDACSDAHPSTKDSEARCPVIPRMIIDSSRLMWQTPLLSHSRRHVKRERWQIRALPDTSRLSGISSLCGRCVDDDFFGDW